MSVIHVILVDDHPFVRTGIRNILNKNSNIQVVGEAGDGFQALQLVDSLEPDVLVLDMEMPGMKGIDVARELRAKGSNMPILALSAYEDRQFILGMLANGAAGYLVKDEVPETIVRAIQGVASGEQGWVSRRVAARIAVWLKVEKPDEIKLDERDIWMLQLFLAGRSDLEISRSVGISEGEVGKRLEDAVIAVRECLYRIF
jgi:DNA-binding NarL/FixJ family response regulator